MPTVVPGLVLGDPAALERLGQRCNSLRHADKEIATLVYEDAAPPIPWWAGHTWPLPLVLMASIAAVVWSPAAWLATGLVLYILRPAGGGGRRQGVRLA